MINNDIFNDIYDIITITRNRLLSDAGVLVLYSRWPEDKQKLSLALVL